MNILSFELKIVGQILNVKILRPFAMMSLHAKFVLIQNFGNNALVLAVKSPHAKFAVMSRFQKYALSKTPRLVSCFNHTESTKEVNIVNKSF